MSKPQEEWTEPITVYVEPKLKKEFEFKANEDDRTLSSALRMLIRRYIDGDLNMRKDD